VNADYFELPAVPASASPSPVPSFFAVTGCKNTQLDPTATAAQCGSPYDTNRGNLEVVTAALDDTLTADNKTVRVQVAHLSPALAVTDGGTVSVTYGPLDAGLSQTLGAALQLGRIGPLSSLTLPASPADYTNDGVTVALVASDGTVAQSLWLPLATVARLSDPSQLPESLFHSPANYLFAVVGDPTAPEQLTLPDGGPNPAYDGRGLHVVAIPTTDPPPGDGGF
jgi:hypothetical protein